MIVHATSRSNSDYLLTLLAIESQLKESINKGWNSIEVSKYEKFNHIERKDVDSSKRDEKRLENMKIYVRHFCENFSWFNDQNY